VCEKVAPKEKYFLEVESVIEIHKLPELVDSQLCNVHKLSRVNKKKVFNSLWRRVSQGANPRKSERKKSVESPES
jgi:hypothetical protein